MGMGWRRKMDECERGERLTTVRCGANAILELTGNKAFGDRVRGICVGQDRIQEANDLGSANVDRR